MLNPAKVGLAVQGGLSAVCATCRLYWEARERNLPDPQCLAKDGCGSPLKGDDFHEYDGPISDLGRWCFVCGADSSYGVLASGRQRVIGACELHVKWLAELRPLTRLDFDPTTGVVRSANGTVPIESLVGRPRKSLLQAIYEVEKHFADKQGRDV